jgi:NADPH-dependent 2,4-dienoyl-CoA reductase/sulfur reductase-like enzyme
VNKNKLNLGSRSAKKERIVIVGGGLAGLRAAERLRELGFEGELAIVGAERRRPYHRPALSKQMLTGELRPKDLTLRSYVPLDATWRRGAYVMKLDTRRRVLEMAGDEEIKYDGLVIATGVQARHLAGAPRHDPRVHVLRTMGDAIALQRSIATGNGKVVVIGGGFTAGEVASTCRDLGCDVTILSRSKVLLGKVVGDDMGNQIAEMHREHGVRIEAGVEVTQWLTQPWGVSMHLSNGKVVVAGTVVLAVGSTPAVQWLRGSGLTLEDGVLCRPTCHVVGANDMVAAGDVARWPNLRFEATPRRVEHWMNAVDMGRAAAESLLAGPEAAKPFTPLPKFWSEQCGMHMQAAGMPALSQDTVPLARRANGGGITGYVRNGRLIGIVGQDDPRGMLKWTEELKRELRRPETVTMPAVRFAAEEIAEMEREVAAQSEPPAPPVQASPSAATQAADEFFRSEPVNRLESTGKRKPVARPDHVGQQSIRHKPVPRPDHVGQQSIRHKPVPRPDHVGQQSIRHEPVPQPSIRHEPVPQPSIRHEPVAPPMGRPEPAIRREQQFQPAPSARFEPIDRPEPAVRPERTSSDFTSAYQALSHFRSAIPAAPVKRVNTSRPGMRPVPPPPSVDMTGRIARPEPVVRPEPVDMTEPVTLPEPVARQDRRMPGFRNDTPTMSRFLSQLPSGQDGPPEHPSFPNMRPVARPMPDDRPEHPSRPNMRPVPRPMADNRPEHPSRPNMRPVPRPMADNRPEHPSRPNMRPVERPLPEFPDMPSLSDFEAEEDFRPEHPSFPNMHPVPRPVPNTGGERGDRLQDWQLGKNDRAQLRMN